MSPGGIRVVVSGYYGMGNLGDEAVLSGLVRSVREAHARGGAGLPAPEFVVLSGDPRGTERMHGVRAVRRTDPWAVLRAIRWADVVVSGGGGLFQDVTGPLTVPYYAAVVLLARLLRRPVVVFAQGVGPLRSWPARVLAGLALRAARSVSVRDESSARLVREITGGRVVPRLVADPAFLVDAAAPGAASTLAADTQGVALLQRSDTRAGRAQPRLGVALRESPSFTGSEPALAEALDRLAARTGARVVFLAMQTPADEAFAGRVRSLMTSPSDLVSARGATPAGMLAVVSTMDVVLAMRYHAMVFALASGVPCVALAYDPKVTALANAMGQSPVLPDAEGAHALCDRIVGAVEGALALDPEEARAGAARFRERMRVLASVAGEAVVAAAGAGAGRAEMPPVSDRRCKVLGLPVDRVTTAQARARIATWMSSGPHEPGAGAAIVVTLNPEIAVAARRNRMLAGVVRDAALVVADGVGIVLASRLLGCPLPERVAGFDLMLGVMEDAARLGAPVFLLGSAPGVASAAACAARRAFPDLVVAGTHHGFFDEAGEGAIVAREIEAAGARVVFVGMGHPRQEAWMAAHSRDTGAAVLMEVGGAFDVLSGRTARAPAWVIRMGLEWLFRMVRQPRRWRRAWALPLFGLMVMTDAAWRWVRRAVGIVERRPGEGEGG